MKKSKAETAKTRQKIVEIASKTIRTKGIAATGVAEIMAAAGLTHGGFYRHFESKDDLVAEAIALSRKDFVAGTLVAADQGAKALLQHFQDYVSAEYRDDIGSGCPLAANGSELVRAEPKTRHVVTEGFRQLIEKSAPLMKSQNGQDRTEAAISVITNMIGALTISRMVDDLALSEQILEITRRRIEKSIDVSKSNRRKKSELELG